MGTYRRRIRLRCPGIGQVTAELEDDFHHFRVLLGHDGSSVTSVAGEAIRFPWTTCPSASTELQGLVGAALPHRATGIASIIRARANCTHLYDLAGLALAQAGGRPDRLYDVAVPDRDESGTTTASIACNGEPVLTWKATWREIVDPPPFVGVALRGSFIAWADADLPDDLAEAAVILRRAMDISMGRLMDLDQRPTAADVGHPMEGTCYTFSAERMPVAFRVRGSTRDFSEGPEALLRRSH